MPSASSSPGVVAQAPPPEFCRHPNGVSAPARAPALDYPRERLEVIVTCDGCEDGTAALARAAGADLVLENPRGGKVRAQDAAVARARGQLVPFSAANPRP